MEKYVNGRWRMKGDASKLEWPNKFQSVGIIVCNIGRRERKKDRIKGEKER
jgi:hypothetical protein